MKIEERQELLEKAIECFRLAEIDLRKKKPRETKITDE